MKQINQPQTQPKFVADEIGDKYKEWQNGQRVFITAPTGSGKSYFIFHKLLERAIQSEEHILYLVNRKILQKQLDEQLRNEITDIMYEKFKCNCSEYIDIRTYQSIESEIKNGDVCGAMSRLNKYNLVVYDECHYFYTDANFNTYTELSYDLLRMCFDNRIQIFMSATMDTMRDLIKRRPALYLPLWGETKYGYPARDALGNELFITHETHTVPQIYDYINVYYFDDINGLIKIISDSFTQGKPSKSGKDRWLIFTDSIEHGKELKRELSKTLGNTYSDEIIFIDASYEKDEEANKAVDHLTEKDFINKSIIISTSVIDNGVSFHDEKLKNIVLLCDTKEEFIQMLGRKRIDGNQINLFICKRNSEHFNRRWKAMNSLFNFYTTNKKYFDKTFARYIRRDYTDYPDSIFQVYSDPRGNISIMDSKNEPVNPTPQGTYVTHDYKADPIILDKNGIYTIIVPPIFDLIYRKKLFLGENKFPYLSFIIYNFILHSQNSILSDILNNPISYNAARALLYSADGLLAFNSFSVERCMRLRSFYKDMAEKLKNDEDAFLECQLSWIGFDKSMIQKGYQLQSNAFRNTMDTCIRQLLGNKSSVTISKDENIELKKSIFIESQYFYAHSTISTESGINQTRKNERPITPEIFNITMREAQLPYVMTKPANNMYEISTDNNIDKGSDNTIE